jgi:hypothetical protein
MATVELTCTMPAAEARRRLYECYRFLAELAEESTSAGEGGQPISPDAGQIAPVVTDAGVLYHNEHDNATDRR